MNAFALPVAPGAPAAGLEISQNPGQDSSGPGGKASDEGASFDAMLVAQAPVAVASPASAKPDAQAVPPSPVAMPPMLASLWQAVALPDAEVEPPDLSAESNEPGTTDAPQDGEALPQAEVVPDPACLAPLMPAPAPVPPPAQELPAASEPAMAPSPESSDASINPRKIPPGASRTSIAAIPARDGLPVATVAPGAPDAPDAQNSPLEDISTPEASQPARVKDSPSPNTEDAGASAAPRTAVPRPTAEAGGVIPSAPVAEQVGKIDSAISAEIGRVAVLQTTSVKSESSAKPDKYSVSGKSGALGTRHAKSEPGMKTLPFPPSVNAVSSSGSSADSQEGDVALQGVSERESGADHAPTANGDALLKVRHGASELAFPLERISAPAGELRGFAAAGRVDVSPAFAALQDVIDKTLSHPGNPMRIELELPVQDGTPVRVRLELRNGEIQTVFRTDSPDLRDALQQAWPQFSHRSHERGLPLGEVRFEASGNTQTSLEQQQQNPSRQSPREAFDFAGAAPRAAKSPAAAIPVRKATLANTAKLSLWA